MLIPLPHFYPFYYFRAEALSGSINVQDKFNHRCGLFKAILNIHFSYSEK
jgi:hypothetical protein